jgi:hypothetical protein
MPDLHVPKIDYNLTATRYWWVCTCGDTGKRKYGYPGLAEQYGNQHAAAMNAPQRVGGRRG